MQAFDDSNPAPPPPFAWIQAIAGEERQAVVLRLICLGLDHASIHAYARENGWHEEPLDIGHYIEVANAELTKAAGEIDTELELGKAHKRLDDLYMKAVQGKDHKTALSIQKEINKILALKVTAARAAGSGTTSGTTQERTRLKIVKK
jgi:hypothetical protein